MRKTVWDVLFKGLISLSILLFSVFSFAINGRTTYQARIIKPDGYPLQASSVNFRFTVLDQTGSCVLYVEDYAAINMTDTGGLISFPLGTGARSFPTSGTAQTFQNTFDNSITSFACQTMGIYNPNPTDTRKIVMQFNDGNGWQTLPAMSINAVPYAMFATRSDNSRALNGKVDTAFVEYSTLNGLSCAADQAIKYNGVSFSCITVGASATPVTSSTVIAALGYTPVQGASFTSLDSTVTSVSSAVYSVSSTVSNLNDSVTSLSNSVAASFAAMTSSQWSTSGTNIFYNGGNVGIGTANPTNGLLDLSTTSDDVLSLYRRSNGANNATKIHFHHQDSNNVKVETVELASVETDATSGSVNGDFTVATVNNSSKTEKFRITSSGNVGIGTATPVTKLSVSGGLRISMESSACAAGFAGTLRYNSGTVEYCNGTSWLPFGVAGAGITNVNGSTSGSQTFATGITGTVFNISTANGIHTFNIPLAASASVTAGLLSNADYLIFTNKLNSTSAAVISALGYTPLNNSVSGTFVVKANNLSDLASATVARANLGLGSLATLNYIDLSSTAASGTLSASSLPSVGAGVTSGAQYTKVTVDDKGRVISGSQVTLNDIVHVYTGNGGLFVGSGTSRPLVEDSNTSESTAFGVNSMAANQSGGQNTAFGFATLESSVTSYENAAFGWYALSANTTGQFNTAIGAESMWSNTTGVENTAIGGAALSDLNGGHYNSALGMVAGGNIAGGDRNVFIGIGAGRGATNANVSRNTIVGGWAGSVINTGADNNVILGYQSGNNLTTGSSNIVIGYNVNASTATVSQSLNIGNLIFGKGLDGIASAISSGNIGIGITNPTAKFHLASGTASAAPLKFTPGTLLASPQSGTIEYDGFDFYLTDGSGVRRFIATGSLDGTYDSVNQLTSSGNISLTPVGSVIVSSTTASTSSNTGALVVKGGVGIAGDLNVAGIVSSSSQIKATGYRANQGIPNANDSSTNGYAFGADGDTGLFSPGSGGANGIVSIFTNNVETVRVTPTAVGIGTSAPTSTLHVYGTANDGSNDIKIDNYSPGVKFVDRSSNTADWRLSADGGNPGKFYLAADTDADKNDDSYTWTNYLTVDSSNGYLGIGTAAPAAKLEVADTAGATNNEVLISSPDTTTGASKLTLKSGTNSAYLRFLPPSTSVASLGGDVTGAGNALQITNSTGKMVFQSSGTLHFQVGAGYNTKLKIDSATGNVGVNTNSPSTTLDVGGYIGTGVGTTQIGGVLGFNRGSVPNTGLVIAGNTGSSNGGYAQFYGTNAVSGTDDRRGNVDIGSYSSGGTPGNINFYTYNGSGWLSRIMIQGTTGNIGMGTMTPAYKLSMYDGATSVVHNIESGSNGSAAYTRMTGKTSGGVTRTMGSGVNISDSNGNYELYDFTAGASRMYVNSSGDIGIGTTAPGANLHVYAPDNDVATVAATGSAQGSGMLYVGQSTAYGAGMLYNGDDSPSMLGNADDVVFFRRDNGVDYEVFKYRYNSDNVVFSGNVGIGTATPQGSLHIVSAVSQTNTPTEGIFLGKSLGNDYQLQLTQTGGTPHIDFSRGGNTDYDARISVSANNSLYLGTTSAGTLLALNGTNVGVGTTTPASKFEVRGGNTFMEGKAYVYSNSGWGAVTPSISLAVGDNDTGLNWVSDGVLQIYGNNAVRMHFATTGNTGVNRADPAYTLDVAGTFRVTGQAYTDTGAATFTVLSDERYKDIHGSYERGLDELLKIGTIRYNYKKVNPTGADSTHEYVGVSAQNVQANIPEAVEKQTSKDGKEFLTVNPSPIIFAMINAFKDMYNKVVALMKADIRHDREIASLKAENEELKSKVKEFDELKAYICKKDPEAPNCKPAK